jgi:hypothetical protein
MGISDHEERAMPIAGWCRSCGANQYVGPNGECPSGHPAADVSNHYDTDTGQPVAPPSAAPIAPAHAAQTAREAVLVAILGALGQYPGYASGYGTDTDIVISNQVADANWGTGKKKVEYEAVLKAVETERTIYFWEILKETGGGLSFGGMEAETYSTFGAKRSGTKKEVVIGPGGKAVDYTWDYAATRGIVEAAAAQQGWTTKTVLRKSKAQW